jgi:Undecaprenyl-phosphate glucose phosphotransferase
MQASLFFLPSYFDAPLLHKCRPCLRCKERFVASRYHAAVSILFRLADAFVIVAVWLACYWLRLQYPFPFAQPKALPLFSPYASLAPMIAMLWAAVFSLLGVYGQGRMRGRKMEVFLLWRAHATALAIFVSLAYLYDQSRYSRLVMVYFAVLGAVVLAAFRVTLRTALRALRRRGYDVRRVLVVGSGPAARTLVERFQLYPELGMRMVALVTADGRPLPESLDIGVSGSFTDIERIVEAERVQEVLIVVPPHKLARLYGVMAKLRDQAVTVQVVPEVAQYMTIGCSVEDFEGMPIIRLNDSPITSWHSIVKRGIDATLSAVGLVAISPLLVLIAVFVKVTSPGPVLYKQERMGLDGRTFRMLKFRSMRVDAEAQAGAVWAKKNDDRCTPIGTFLRKTSLDELPQLWNVFVGHMSLVGPRPERPVFIQQFRSQIPGYMLRHKVKSGITGWAQVNGWRGDTSIAERTECDLYYIRNWSLNLDLKILTMTLWKGFINKNAY